MLRVGYSAAFWVTLLQVTLLCSAIDSTRTLQVLLVVFATSVILRLRARVGSRLYSKRPLAIAAFSVSHLVCCRTYPLLALHKGHLFRLCLKIDTRLAVQTMYFTAQQNATALEDLIRHGWFTEVVDCLRSEEVALRAEAVSTLKIVSERSITSGEVLASAGVIDPLVEMLDSKKIEGSIIEHALVTLRNMGACSEEIGLQILKAGVLPRLLFLMQDPVTHFKSRHQTVGSIGVLMSAGSH